MKLLAIIGWGTIIFPIIIIGAKSIGWLKLSWLFTLLLAIGIPAIVSCLFIVLAVWVITKTYREEWDQQ